VLLFSFILQVTAPISPDMLPGPMLCGVLIPLAVDGAVLPPE